MFWTEVVSVWTYSGTFTRPNEEKTSSTPKSSDILGVRFEMKYEMKIQNASKPYSEYGKAHF